MEDIPVSYTHLDVYKRQDDAIGDSVGQRAQRVADGNGDLAHGQGVTVADDCRGQTRSINFQHRNVGGGILTDDGGVVALVAAVQLHLYAGRAVDDVGACLLYTSRCV